MSALPERGGARPTVSAIVVCFNEERNIAGCLESLCWCDEIIVVDSFSTDGTPEICKRYTEHVIRRAWSGYRDQKAFAHAQATQDWVLFLDADERVTPELRDEIRQALEQEGDRYCGFAVPRVVFFLGRWWWRGGWYPDLNVRLFRRDRGTWSGTEPHAKVLVNGTVRRLHHPLHHLSYRDMGDHLQKINRYTSISSTELFRQEKHWHWMDALARPLLRFFRCYVLKRGFLEGFAGFYVAVTAAVYVFLKYAKLWELEMEAKKKGGQERS